MPCGGPSLRGKERDVELERGQIDGQANAPLQPQALPAVPKVPKMRPLVARLVSELKARPPVEISGERVKQELDGVRFGLRCMMANSGAGFRARKAILEQVHGMADAAVDQRADATLTLIMNVFQFVRAAEDVIVRHGLLDEYKAQVAHLQDAVGRLVSMPSSAQLEALKATLEQMGKGGADGEGGVKLSDAGAEGDGAVGPEGVSDHQQPPADGVRGGLG